MAIKFEKIKPGMMLWDVRKNTCLVGLRGKWSCWSVKIISVDTENRTVVASWNGNKEKTYSERNATKWRAKKPE